MLLLADDCNPDWPSLPVVGFKMCRAIAEHADVVVATHVRNRASIVRVGIGNATVEYLDNEYVASPLYKFATLVRGGENAGWTTKVALGYPSHVAFEYEAYRRFRDALRSGRFDVVHRVTPMSPTMPSPMASWSRVPFVLGPLNGGLRWPDQFTSELIREREWFVYLRGACRWLPYYRSTYRDASAILAAFKHTSDDLPASARERVIEFPEIGIDPELFAAPPVRRLAERSTFLFVGRLVPLKCVDVLVEAFSQSELLRAQRLLVVGDGPERTRLEAMVRSRGLGQSVQMTGWKTQAEVGQLMRQADVFVFPSIRELGAGVVVEAMACGLPCIVVDYGGPGGLVSDAVGIKVRLGDKPSLVRSFARAMESLSRDPVRRREMGCAASSHAIEEYSWDAKARKMLRVYEWVLGRSGAKPVIHTPPRSG